jgi:hypothetical protein
VSVSSFASQHRAMGPTAGMERVSWTNAPRGAPLNNPFILESSSVASMGQASSLPKVVGKWVC